MVGITLPTHFFWVNLIIASMTFKFLSIHLDKAICVNLDSSISACHTCLVLTHFYSMKSLINYVTAVNWPPLAHTNPSINYRKYIRHRIGIGSQPDSDAKYL